MVWIFSILPWAWGGAFPRYDRLVPDGEMWIEDVKRAAAAVGLRVGTGKHPSQHKEFPSEHAAAVVGQRRDLPFSLEGTRKEDWGVGVGKTLKS